MCGVFVVRKGIPLAPATVIVFTLSDSSALSLNFDVKSSVCSLTSIRISGSTCLGSISSMSGADISGEDTSFLISFRSWLRNKTRIFPIVGDFLSLLSTMDEMNCMALHRSGALNSSKPSMTMKCVESFSKQSSSNDRAVTSLLRISWLLSFLS